MKTLLFFCTSLIALTAAAQIDIRTYTTATDTFYWKRYISIPKPGKLNLKKYASPGQGKLIDRILSAHAAEFPEFAGDSTETITTADRKKYFFQTDINDDGLTDIIYSGPGGGEQEIVRIYQNTRDSFELVFEDYQYLTRFTRENKKLSAVSTGDIGSHGNYLTFTKNYRVEWDGGKPVFVRGKKTVMYRYTEAPREYYPEPLPFVAVADTLLLRSSAAMLNEPFNPNLDTFGNIVAKYRSKARGVILAKKTYGKGNDWFLVEMMPGVYPTASILYDTEQIPAFLVGWVSALSVSLPGK